MNQSLRIDIVRDIFLFNHLYTRGENFLLSNDGDWYDGDLYLSKKSKQDFLMSFSGDVYGYNFTISHIEVEYNEDKELMIEIHFGIGSGAYDHKMPI